MQETVAQLAIARISAPVDIGFSSPRLYERIFSMRWKMLEAFCFKMHRRAAPISFQAKHPSQQAPTASYPLEPAEEVIRTAPHTSARGRYFLAYNSCFNDFQTVDVRIDPCCP